MVDSKENSKFDLRVKGLINFSFVFHENVTFMNQVHGCKALYFAHNFDDLSISCHLQGLLNGFLNKLKESERRNRRNRRG